MRKIEKFLKRKTKNIIGLKETVSLVTLFVLLLSTAGMVFPERVGADSDPRCLGGNCTAQDANFQNIWLSVADEQCEPGELTSAVLKGNLNINRANGICHVVSVVDIYLDGEELELNVINELGNFANSGIYEVDLATINWSCGSVVTIENVHAQWIHGTGSGCPVDAPEPNDGFVYGPPKCYFNQGPLVIAAPLVADF